MAKEKQVIEEDVCPICSGVLSSGSLYWESKGIEDSSQCDNCMSDIYQTYKTEFIGHRFTQEKEVFKKVTE